MTILFPYFRLCLGVFASKEEKDRRERGKGNGKLMKLTAYPEKKKQCKLDDDSYDCVFKIGLIQEGDAIHTRASGGCCLPRRSLSKDS